MDLAREGRAGWGMYLLLALLTLAVASPAVHGQSRTKIASKQVARQSLSVDRGVEGKVLSAQRKALAGKYPSLAGKVEDELLEAWDIASGGDAGAALRKLKARGAILAENGRDVAAIVTVRPATTPGEMVPKLKAAGAAVVRVGPDNVKVTLPLDQLNAVAALAGVVNVRTLRPPRHKNTTKTEGVAKMLASAWHAAGHRGDGVKVAVVDTSFSNLATLKSQDEIPSSAVEMNYSATGMTAGSGTHGSGCAEIVYDMAPGAELHLIKVDDETDLVTVKDYCVAQGISIATCSLGWDAINFHDGTARASRYTTVANHPVTAVQQAAANGILWANAAGNEQRQHTLIDWRDADGDNFLDWEASQGNLNTLWYGGSSTIPAGVDIWVYLTWNHWPVSSSDFDLRLYKNTGSGWEVAAVGEDVQNGSATSYPYEELHHETEAEGQYAVAVIKFDPITTAKFILRYYGVDEPTYFSYDEKYAMPPGSVVIPGDAAEAFTVGALNQATYTTGTIEDFSSLGPNNRAYTGGSAVTKPDICGPNRTASVSYPGTFAGTSAATPHVAGAAALVKGAFPAYTHTQVRQYLEANGFDLGTAGKDNTYGAGASRLPSPPPVNRAPTDVALNASSVEENRPAGTSVGTLSTTDPDAGDSHTYTLVSGAGSGDNASFSISGRTLRTATVFDYETKNSYGIRVRTTDGGGLHTEKAVTISVTDADDQPRMEEAGVVGVDGNELILKWSSFTSQTYRILHGARLDQPLLTLVDGIPATPPMNERRVDISGYANRYYRVQVVPE